MDAVQEIPPDPPVKYSGDRFIVIWEKIIFSAKLMGVNLFKDNYQFGPRLYAFMGVVCGMLVCQLYMFTRLDLYEIDILLEGLANQTLNVQGILKTVLHLQIHWQFKELQARVANLHDRYKTDVEAQECLGRCVTYVLWCVRFFAVAYTFVFIAYTSYPVFMKLIYDNRETLLPVYFPGTDIKNNKNHYTITVMIQILFIWYGTYGLLFADMTFLVLSIHTMPMAEILQLKVDRLNAVLEKENSTYIEKRDHLNECIKHHCDYILYIKLLQDSYTWIVFVQVMTSMFSIILSLFLIVLKQWIVGPFLILAIYNQLFEYCLIGTVCQLQTDKVYEAVLSINWYRMPPKLGRMVTLMIFSVQNQTEMKMGSFGDLNVAAFLQATKAIYTYFIMILNYLK